jgi:putative nucleotidyltransferase with HDIG domain
MECFMGTLKKIPVGLAVRGMYVDKLCCSWLENPFWTKSFAIDSDAVLQKILDCDIAELWIDTSRGADLTLDPAPTPAPSRSGSPAFAFAPVEAVSMAEELQVAAKLVATSKAAVMSMFNEARMGQLSDVALMLPIVDDIAASVMRNANALISLTRLKQADDYTYMHSVAVSAMMLALARQLALGDEEARACALAGLLHDIGKMAVPLEILNKPGKLSDAEFHVVKGHPDLGYGILTAVSDMPAIALEVCLHHHEKFGGGGYPHGLAGEQISLHARMGAVCDVYDAITSDRPYKAGWTPSESLQRMDEWTKGGHFDPEVFAAFVKCIGIYPVGTLLRLESGRLGVVLDNSKSLLQPVVRVFFSTTSMAHILPGTVDLAAPGARDAIASAEDAETWGLGDVEHYWMAATV